MPTYRLTMKTQLRKNTRLPYIMEKRVESLTVRETHKESDRIVLYTELTGLVSIRVE